MKLKHRTIPLLALTLMGACTDDGATGVAPDDLAGTWTATAMVFSSVADPTTTVDVVTEGAALTLVLNADGTYSFVSVFPGEPDEDETGTFSVSGDVMTITPTGLDPETFAIFRDGDTLTLTDSDTFDFGQGVEEDALLVITLVRL